MNDKVPRNTNGEKKIIRGLGFCSTTSDSNSVQVEVSDGRIIRIRPLHYDWEYKDLKPWRINARGKTFQPSMKSLIPPFSLGYKNRVYSPNRVLYPMKRIDWDPNGERNPQNRGVSKYVRISWDEALDIIVKEIKRIRQQYGMEAILSQSDGHGETYCVHAAHGTHRRLLSLLGGYTLQTRNTDSWEGWYWGAKHVWGCETNGFMHPVTNVVRDVARHSDAIFFWGCDPETTPWAFDGQLASRFTGLLMLVLSLFTYALISIMGPRFMRTNGYLFFPTPMPPFIWRSPISGSPKTLMIKNMLKRIPWALKNSGNMSWAMKTGSRRPRNGLLRLLEFLHIL